MSSIDATNLPPKARQRIGARRGAYIAHERHPDLAKEAGSKGGRTTAERHPHLSTSAHGKALALAKKLKKEGYLRALAAELDSMKKDGKEASNQED
ncbi:MAG: hypothetical protein AB7V46_17825 [Thermomicrobiales bacterium]